jgi:hypothetical protein
MKRGSQLSCRESNVASKKAAKKTKYAEKPRSDKTGENRQ